MTAAALAAPALRYRHCRILLAAGVLAPVIALGSVVAAMLAFPGFDNATQYLSELGAAGAAKPELFNVGVFVSGIGAVAAGLGFALAAHGLGGSRIAAALTALSFAVAGAGLIIAALYHWPDPRHRAVNLALGIQLAPLLLLWSLRKASGVKGLRLFLLLSFAVMALLTLLTKHLLLPGTVHDGNVGWWERGFAIVLVGWAPVAALCLERRLAAERS